MKVSYKEQKRWNEEFERAADIIYNLPGYFDECITQIGPPVSLKELILKDYIEKFSNPEICLVKFNPYKFCKACGISTKTVILDDRFEQYMGAWTIKGVDPYDEAAKRIAACRVMVTNGHTMINFT